MIKNFKILDFPTLITIPANGTLQYDYDVQWNCYLITQAANQNGAPINPAAQMQIQDMSANRYWTEEFIPVGLMTSLIAIPFVTEAFSFCPYIERGTQIRIKFRNISASDIDLALTFWVLEEQDIPEYFRYPKYYPLFKKYQGTIQANETLQDKIELPQYNCLFGGVIAGGDARLFYNVRKTNKQNIWKQDVSSGLNNIWFLGYPNCYNNPIHNIECIFYFRNYSAVAVSYFFTTCWMIPFPPDNNLFSLGIQPAAKQKI